ncbi:hypothetical protein NP493_498g00010 [Ridgeia piscesae]|uniref:Uncharacterized protein n=1 Tax=Ridgeia piscesae TaxID=27915 RepID=A0AAD9NSP9_RIDPI|nr:hypothetical protein NP493_498g00010 [Ridgeia piscesae]
MGKKGNKGRGPSTKPEMFTRINFLYQAAHRVLLESPNNTGLVRFYAYTLRSIAMKNVLRLDPTIKRTLCKKCSMLLIPGVTATVRHRGHKQRHTVVTCLECNVSKRFVTSSTHTLWCEQEEAKTMPSNWGHPPGQCNRGTQQRNVQTNAANKKMQKNV